MAAALPLGAKWPDSNTLAPQGEQDTTFHAYVHIPFCAVRCGYCDFNTYTASEVRGVSQAEFHKHLIREIEFSRMVLEQSKMPHRPLSTVFFGGGTPSLFSANQIAEILSALESVHGLAEDIEVTLEANPEGLELAKLIELRDCGVNRISLGVQSFDGDVLRVLDRVHTKSKIISAAEGVLEAGLRLSLDLIYGTPGESLESWEETLNLALSLQPEHISAYSLIIEEGTAIERKISKQLLANVDEDLNAEKYLLTESILTSAGLKNYEVSNWGVPSKHNQCYWQSNDWWGYGPGAHSHLAGNRFWNHKHPQTYSVALASGSPAAGIEVLDRRTQLEERLLLRLRTGSGVEMGLIKELQIPSDLVAKAISDGLLILTPDRRLVTTLRGRLLVDGLVLDFLSKSAR